MVEATLNPEGNLLRSRRVELKLSQGDLLLRLRHRGIKVSITTIARWERRQSLCGLEHQTLEALADALHLSLSDFMKAIE